MTTSSFSLKPGGDGRAVIFGHWRCSLPFGLVRLNVRVWFWFLTVGYCCSSPTAASFSLDRHYPLFRHQRSTEYEEEIEMNGLLCGPKQPEIIHHEEEGTKAVVQDLVKVETRGLSPLKPKLEEHGVWAQVRPAPTLTFVSFPETSVSNANNFAIICGWCNVSRPNLIFCADRSVALYGMSLCWIKGKAF